MNLQKNRDLVRKLLDNHPKLRDNDRELIAEVYRIEAERKYGAPTSDMCLAIFLADFAGSAFTSPEAIRRSRALLQQRHPELRGRRYAERRTVCVEKAKSTIGASEAQKGRIRAAMTPGGETPKKLFE